MTEYSRRGGQRDLAGRAVEPQAEALLEPPDVRATWHAKGRVIGGAVKEPSSARV